MKFLIFETSGEDSFIALSLDGQMTSLSIPSREQHAHLLPSIDPLLKNTNLLLSDLDFLAVGTGPGSFTGTRIGVLTAKTLGFAKNLSILPFCSMIRLAPSNPGPFLILIDAKSQGIYSLKGFHDSKILSYTTPTLESRNLIPEKLPLFSPHPERLPFQAKPSLLNLPLLSRHLEEKFQAGKALSPHAIEVSYLHTP